jgi:hypothetical protein
MGRYREEVVPMDPDQDLLDQLDRRETGGLAFAIMVMGGLAALAGIITYFTLSMELQAAPEVSRDAAALVFIISAALLGVSHYRFR